MEVDEQSTQKSANQSIGRIFWIEVKETSLINFFFKFKLFVVKIIVVQYNIY